MIETEATHYRWEDIPRGEMTPSVARRFIATDRVTLAQLHFEEGATVAGHVHESEQLTYVLEGKLRLWLGEDESRVVDVSSGEVLHIPSNIPHRAEALERTLAVDVFSPPRQDWLEQASS